MKTSFTISVFEKTKKKNGGPSISATRQHFLNKKQQQ